MTGTLVLSEQSEGWWVPTFNELDSAQRRFGTETIGAPSADAMGTLAASIPDVLPGSNAFLGHSGPWQDDPTR